MDGVKSKLLERREVVTTSEVYMSVDGNYCWLIAACDSAGQKLVNHHAKCVAPPSFFIYEWCHQPLHVKGDQSPQRFSFFFLSLLVMFLSISFFFFFQVKTIVIVVMSKKMVL